MRLLSLAALGVSTLALSGCSFFNGLMGQPTHHGANSHHNGGYYAAPACGNRCVGGKQISKWNIEAGAGPDFIVGGDAITGGDTHQAFVGQQINSISMQDAYDDAYSVGLGGSYMINPNRKLTGQYLYSAASGETNVLGTEVGAATPTNATLSDYESHGVEAGLRQYFTPRVIGQSVRYRPYVEGKLGAAYVDDISLTTVQQGNAASARTVDFYDGGWVPTAAGLVGVETPIFNRATLGIETGLRYTGALDSADGLRTQAPNLSGANNGSERWTVPLQIRGRYRF